MSAEKKSLCLNVFGSGTAERSDSSFRGYGDVKEMEKENRILLVC